MLKSITWSSYWLIIVAVIFIYYIIICGKFYVNEIKNIFARNSRLYKEKGRNFPSFCKNEKDDAHFKSTDELMRAINQFVSEIKTTLEHSAKNRLMKEEIIFSIQHLSKKYALIKNSPFKSFINNYVLAECSNYCSIHLDEDELNMLWEN